MIPLIKINQFKHNWNLHFPAFIWHKLFQKFFLNINLLWTFYLASKIISEIKTFMTQSLNWSQDSNTTANSSPSGGSIIYSAIPECFASIIYRSHKCPVSIYLPALPHITSLFPSCASQNSSFSASSFLSRHFQHLASGPSVSPPASQHPQRHLLLILWTKYRQH